MLTKKRYTLEPPQVKDYLVKGERFTKWSEVSPLLHALTEKQPVLQGTGPANPSNISIGKQFQQNPLVSIGLCNE